MKENNDHKKLNTQIKNRKTYELQKFGETEDENFKVLANMLEKMPSLKDKYFFKQLGQFFGGLYTIALNREKLKGLKRILEKYKSPDKGVKGVKKYVEEFVKIPVKTNNSIKALISLIKFLGQEVQRSNSMLSRISKQFENVMECIPDKIGYKKFISAIKEYSSADCLSYDEWDSMFKGGWYPWASGDLAEKDKMLYMMCAGYGNFYINWLQMTKIVRDQILKSQRNPELRVYSPEKIQNKYEDRDVDGTQKMYENMEVCENLSIKDVQGLFSALESGAGSPVNVFKRFGEGLGELYAVCEQSRGLIRGMFSNSSKGARGAVKYIQEFLKSPGGTEKCAKCLDDLMKFLLGPKGCSLSSSRLADLKEVLPETWEKLRKSTVEYANLDEFIKSHSKEVTSNDVVTNAENNPDKGASLYLNWDSGGYWAGTSGYLKKGASLYLKGDEKRKMDYKFHVENFVPAKLKMAKIVQRSCLNQYNGVKSLKKTKN